MNQKMTRQLDEKDEQMQEIRQKVDSVSLDLRRSEKAKREVINYWCPIFCRCVDFYYIHHCVFFVLFTSDLTTVDLSLMSSQK